MTHSLVKKELIKDAIAAAKEEGFINAASWDRRELLIWYKSYLEFIGQKVPISLRRIKVDL